MTHLPTRAFLVLCLLLPWLNPFAPPPSTSIWPLLLSWMLSACALVLVADVPAPRWRASPRQWGWGAVLLLSVAVSVIRVPEVNDRALTAGLVMALACVAAMAVVGYRLHACTPSAWRLLAQVWLAAALISCGLGLLQYLDLAHLAAPWVNQSAYGDAFANLRQRNQFASLTSLGLVALLALVCTERGEPTRWGRLWPWLALQLLAMGAAASSSRTGGVQWVVVVLFTLWWCTRRPGQRIRWQLALAAPLCVVLWSVVLPLLAQWWDPAGGAAQSLLGRVTGSSGDYAACASRRVLWANAWALAAARPWWGWGWGELDYAHFSTDYAGPRFCDLLDNAHNLPLHLAVELGWHLTLLLIGSVAVWLWRAAPWRAHHPAATLGWGAIGVLAIHSLLEYPLWYGPFQMTLGLALGLLASQAASARGTPPLASAQGRTVPWLIMGSALFAAALYAAWDYQRVSQIYRPAAARDARYSDAPLAHAKASWLFRNQADFAELVTAPPVSEENAAALGLLAERLLHYSPEPRVVDRAIAAAKARGQEALAQRWQAQRDAIEKAGR